jgi:hypothetical protein
MAFSEGRLAKLEAAWQEVQQQQLDAMTDAELSWVACGGAGFDTFLTTLSDAQLLALQSGGLPWSWCVEEYHRWYAGEGEA